MARRAASTASAGQSSQRLLATNSAIVEVARMDEPTTAAPIAQVPRLARPAPGTTGIGTCMIGPRPCAGSPGVSPSSRCLLAAAPARAQLFVASRPDPPFTIGPLMVRATVTEGPGPVPVVVGFSLQLASEPAAPPTSAQDVFLLWPGEVVNAAPDRKADATLARYVTDQGFEITARATVKLVARQPGRRGHRGGRGRAAPPS